MKATDAAITFTYKTLSVDIRHKERKKVRERKNGWRQEENKKR